MKNISEHLSLFDLKEYLKICEHVLDLRKDKEFEFMLERINGIEHNFYEVINYFIRHKQTFFILKV